MNRFLSYYHPKMPLILVYMLQQVEYNPHLFLDWFCRFPNLSRVTKRQKLVRTRKATALLVWNYYIAVLYLGAVVYLAFINLIAGFACLILLPFVIAGGLFMLTFSAWTMIEEPRRYKLLARSKRQFKNHPGLKIAIAGSYGKTSMKELLLTVLSTEKSVVATPGNKNVPVSHARWIATLSGNEEVLLIEYGEGAPGDIAQFAKITNPDIGIIAGVAPNHLERYKTLHAVEKDLLSLANFVEPDQLFVNADDPKLASVKEAEKYSHSQVLGWTIFNIRVDYDGTKFVMKNGKKTMHLHSGLLGRHQVGPLAFTAALAHKLGISIKSIESAIEQTTPYEHRMQPRQLHGAWIIDDTYNGNLQGILAGLELMKTLKAKRKTYVTPGLVDQGQETEHVHLAIGRAIADAAPDKVVLMQNSVADIIKQGLIEREYGGEIQVEDDPLTFYTSLEHHLAAGDLLVMQNDWTDNYS